MFDINKIGKRISSLRKQCGLTQMELADRLGISFQAVSNWERGNTMPDISKLPEIAEIFNVSIEEILGDERKARIVQDIAEGQTPADVTAKDLADIAPIVSDEQFKKAYEQVDTDDSPVEFDTLMEIAPFLDDDVLGEFLKNYAKNGLTMQQVCALAPFCCDEVLDEVAELIVTDKDSIEDFASLAPFISEETIAKLAKKYLANGASIFDLTQVAIHMNEDDVADMVAKYVAETNDISKINEFAIYMDEDDLTKIAVDYVNNGGKIKDIMPIAPFLDMNELFKRFIKK